MALDHNLLLQKKRGGGGYEILGGHGGWYFFEIVCLFKNFSIVIPKKIHGDQIVVIVWTSIIVGTHVKLSSKLCQRPH